MATDTGKWAGPEHESFDEEGLDKADATQLQQLAAKHGSIQFFKGAKKAVHDYLNETFDDATKITADLELESLLTAAEADQMLSILNNARTRKQTTIHIDDNSENARNKKKTSHHSDDEWSIDEAGSPILYQAVSPRSVNDNDVDGLSWACCFPHRTYGSVADGARTSTQPSLGPRNDSTQKKPNALTKAFKRIEVATAELRSALEEQNIQNSRLAALGSPFQEQGYVDQLWNKQW